MHFQEQKILQRKKVMVKMQPNPLNRQSLINRDRKQYLHHFTGLVFLPCVYCLLDLTFETPKENLLCCVLNAQDVFSMGYSCHVFWFLTLRYIKQELTSP